MMGCYRYGFNGMEKDDQIKGSGNSYDFGNRIYDSRIGRFLSLDRLAREFPWQSPYMSAGNCPIAAIDVDGDHIYIVIEGETYDVEKNWDNEKVQDKLAEIGYSTLDLTDSGNQTLGYYAGSDSEHVYIATTSITKEEGKQAPQGSTLRKSFQMKKGDAIKLSGDFAIFNGEAKAEGRTKFIIINQDFIDNEMLNADGTSYVEQDNSEFNKAAVLFHEIIAHVFNGPRAKKDWEVAKVSIKQEHFNTHGVQITQEELSRKYAEFTHTNPYYGSSKSGYNMKSTLNTEASKINIELTKLKNS